MMALMMMISFDVNVEYDAHFFLSLFFFFCFLSFFSGFFFFFEGGGGEDFSYQPNAWLLSMPEP